MKNCNFHKNRILLNLSRRFWHFSTIYFHESKNFNIKKSVFKSFFIEVFKKVLAEKKSLKLCYFHVFLKFKEK